MATSLVGVQLSDVIGAFMFSAVLTMPTLISFLVTLSDVTLIDVGSAFWGLVAGALAMLFLGAKEDDQRAAG